MPKPLPTVAVYLTAEQREVIRVAAAQRAMSMSDFGREAMLEKAMSEDRKPYTTEQAEDHDDAVQAIVINALIKYEGDKRKARRLLLEALMLLDDEV